MARIVVVEDSPDNMHLFRAVLRHYAHEVVGLSDGTHLIEALDAHSPELVLMDIQLPGRDGFTLLEEIRRSRWKEVRVVALTAHAMAGDTARALEAGFDGYITKPIDVATFPDLVVRALAGEIVTPEEEA